MSTINYPLLLENGFIYRRECSRKENNIYVDDCRVTINIHSNYQVITLYHIIDEKSDIPVITIGVYRFDYSSIIRLPRFKNKDLSDFIIDLAERLRHIEDKSDDQIAIDYFNEAMRRMDIIRLYLYRKYEELVIESSNLSFNHPCKSAAN